MNFIFILLTLPIILLVIAVHEFAHAKAADLLGDPTPRLAGRLTLNPLKHIDPIGLLMLIFVRFGWAKPVPINPYNFKDPKYGLTLVGAAGPASNFFLAWVLSLALKFMPASLSDLNIIFIALLQYSVWINIALAVFNLIPIPPLDGSRILPLFISSRSSEILYELERYGFFILIAILIFPGTSQLLVFFIDFIYRLLV